MASRTGSFELFLDIPAAGSEGSEGKPHLD